MSYGLAFLNNSGVRVIGQEEDNLKFIGKITAYTTASYAYMTYMTFTVTSTEFPIVYLYLPYDDVGTCSNATYTDMSSCVINGGSWIWTNTNEINLAVVHNIYNTTGDTWEVTVIGSYGGYPKNACLYVFNESGSTPSTDAYGFRTYKADGTTLAYDSGFKPLIAKWGASFNSVPSGSFGVDQRKLLVGDWSSRNVDKPAFNCSFNNMAYTEWNSIFCFEGDMYWYMLYYRHFVSIIPDGVNVFSTTPSGRYHPSNDYVTTNRVCVNPTSAFAGSSGGWYYKTKTMPMIDGADYD